jgi:hypothetical protein
MYDRTINQLLLGDRNMKTTSINVAHDHTSKTPLYKLQEAAIVMGIILEAQQHCAHCTVQIGSVSDTGQVQHMGIHLVDAAPRVLSDLEKAGMAIGVHKGLTYVSHRNG